MELLFNSILGADLCGLAHRKQCTCEQLTSDSADYQAILGGASFDNVLAENLPTNLDLKLHNEQSHPAQVLPEPNNGVEATSTPAQSQFLSDNVGESISTICAVFQPQKKQHQHRSGKLPALEESSLGSNFDAENTSQLHPISSLYIQ